MSLLRSSGGWPVLPLLLGLSACASEPCFLTSPRSVQPGIVPVGTPVRLEVSPLRDGECGGPMDVHPTSLTVEISDPDLQPVASQAVLGSPSTANATLRFTPDKPGRYHIFAAFDPTGGVHQFDLQAARDRSDEASLEELPRACQGLERTRRGTWLCDADVFREGLLVQQLPPGRMAVAGDVVWIVDAQRIHRFEDTGETTLVATSSMPHELGLPVFLQALEDELVMLHLFTLQRITFDGAVLSATAVTPVRLGAPDPFNGNNPRGILLRAGDRLAVVSRPQEPSLGLGIVQVCTFQLEAGRFVLAPGSCQQFSAQVVGFEPGVLWLGEPDTGTVTTLNRLEWTEEGLVPRGSLGLSGMQLPFPSELDRPSAVPLLKNARGLFAPDNIPALPIHLPGKDQLELEYLDTQIATGFASPSFFWSAPVPGGAVEATRIRIRPSTP